MCVVEVVMKKALIFGAGGFVGSYLAKELQNNDYCVYGSDVNAVNIDGVESFCADLLDFDSVYDAITKIYPDVIINLAAISSVGVSWEFPQTTITVNVIGALNIVEAARKCSAIPKIMFVGSSEEYDESNKPIDETVSLNANNPYGISKIAQEGFARVYQERYGMKIYCVRPFNHTGVGQKDTFVLPSFCKQVAEIEKSGKPGVIKVGNLAAERDFSDVRDIVRAYRMIIESDDCSRVYNVGSGKAYKLQEMLDYTLTLCNQKITVEIDQKLFRPIDTSVICCDNGLIKNELGWEPEYNIFDTLKEMFEYYKNQREL